jgi:hypothetical protein
MQTLPALFLALRPCAEAQVFAASKSTPQEAWDQCARADWMLWLIARTRSRVDLVNAALDCAASALPFIKEGATAIAALLAIHVTREWTEDRADLEDVRAAAAYATYAVYDAATARSATAACDAATARSAYAAADAAYAAAVDTAADAAYDAAYDAAHAAAYSAVAARADHHRLMCNLIRHRFPLCPIS